MVGHALAPLRTIPGTPIIISYFVQFSHRWFSFSLAGEPPRRRTLRGFAIGGLTVVVLGHQFQAVAPGLIGLGLYRLPFL